MAALSTRSLAALVALLTSASFSLPALHNAAFAQSHSAKRKHSASHESMPLLARLAGAQLQEVKKSLGKPLPESDKLPEGCYYFPGRACGCDKLYVYANPAGRIITVSADFSQELTWQEALKKVGISDKGVKAKVKTLPAVSAETRTETMLTGIAVVRKGFNITFNTGADSAGEQPYQLTIKK